MQWLLGLCGSVMRGWRLDSLRLTGVLGVSTAGSGPVWSRILAGLGGALPPWRASHLLAVSWGRGGFRERQGSGCSGEQGGAPRWEAEDKGHHGR